MRTTMNAKHQGSRIFYGMGVVIVIIGLLTLTYSIGNYVNGSEGGHSRINRWGTIEWNINKAKWDTSSLDEAAWGVLITLLGVSLLLKSKRISLEGSNAKD